ncbi:MAG: hypothetical protein GX650_01090 [Clostridiales bacterium]|nr:hypothetical protein [Clostridiales bacterium]
MTGLGKYEQGLRLEAEGLSGEKIAEKLGYKDAASWYASKAYYKRRQADILERSKPRTDNTPKKAAIMEGVSERVAITSNKPAIDWPAHKEARKVISQDVSLADKPHKPDTAFEMELTIQGKHLSFTSNGLSMGMRKKGSRDRFLRFEMSEAEEYISEIVGAVRAVRERLGVEL